MRENNFDLLRLLAALGVFFAHGSFLYDRQLPIFFNNNYSLGSLSVYVFFFISGHLTLQSWNRNPQWFSFARKRFLRIFPGLFMAAFVSVFVIGGLMTSMDITSFLSSTQTWGLFVNYASALATRHDLPGVFVHNPFPYAVNGSLWTIKYEIAMYGLLVICGMSGLLSQRRIPLVAAAAIVAFFGVNTSMQGDYILSWSDFWQFGIIFFLGAAFNYIPPHRRLWTVPPLLAGLMLSSVSSTVPLIHCGVFLWLPCLIFLLAYCLPLKRIHLRHDLSYGIYVYAFPVQQAATQISLAHGVPKSVCMATSLAVVLLLALWSWVCIERPAIAWGQSSSRLRNP